MTDKQHDTNTAPLGSVTQDQFRSLWAEVRGQGRTLADQDAKLDNMATVQDRILQALTSDELNADAKPGLMRRVKDLEDAHQEHRDEHEERDARQLTFKHGAALAVVSAAVSAILTRIADAFTRGASPPGHP